MTWTLDGPAEYKSVIRNSVFLARAVSVPDERSALAFLEEVAAEEATHHCWAFRIGQRFRSSDDGEPAGTAGRPILSAIDGQDFDHVMMVVTRWFGGVKLGAGGLVRAYGGAAAACLRAANRIERFETVRLRFHCPFSLYAQLEARLPAWRAEKLDCSFDAAGAWLVLAVPAVSERTIVDELRDLTRGQVAIATLEE